METIDIAMADYEVNDSELEHEGYTEEEAMDSIFVLDGRGRMVKLEVPDDD